MKELNSRWISKMRKAMMLVSPPYNPQDVQNYKKMGKKRGGKDISKRIERIVGKKRDN